MEGGEAAAASKEDEWEREEEEIACVGAKPRCSSVDEIHLHQNGSQLHLNIWPPCPTRPTHHPLLKQART